MKIIIAGGRDIDISIQILDLLIKKSDFVITEVVCGDCRGVDKTGNNWAIKHNIPVKHFPVTEKDWELQGPEAGPIRNKKMASYADGVILIWDGKSTGSANMMKCAKDRGLAICEFLYSLREERDAK